MCAAASGECSQLFLPPPPSPSGFHPPCAHRFPISRRVDSRIGLHLNNQKGVIPSNDNSCEGHPSRFPCLMIFVCQSWREVAREFLSLSPPHLSLSVSLSRCPSPHLSLPFALI